MGKDATREAARGGWFKARGERSMAAAVWSVERQS
jgi:hypothetical protein